MQSVKFTWQLLNFWPDGEIKSLELSGFKDFFYNNDI